ncbi:MAG: glutathione S-transferase [Alphaproteobacteria bacterium]|nr:glutathione S-transferase [Alphaproteobacteria bacterium]
MKLYWSPNSPFVRKVWVSALETGTAARIERILTSVQQCDESTELLRTANPLGKIPTLVDTDGEVLYGSTAICELIDSLHDGPKIFPPAGRARWRALRHTVLGDGILEASVLVNIESKRRPERQSPTWIAHQTDAIRRALDALEEEADTLTDPLTIGHITIGCALGTLDFRMNHLEWRRDRPRLAAWCEAFSARPSMLETAPVKL